MVSQSLDSVISVSRNLVTKQMVNNETFTISVEYLVERPMIDAFVDWRLAAKENAREVKTKLNNLKASSRHEKTLEKNHLLST